MTTTADQEAHARSAPEEGHVVLVRGRPWAVKEVAGGSAAGGGPLDAHPGASDSAGSQHVISLSSLADDSLGEELRIVWELEPGAGVLERGALPTPVEADGGGFDPPDRLDAFLDAVRWGASSTADVKQVQSPFRAGIDVEDYQLDPVVRAVGMPRANLLIADDVGLGKTIEAGLVASELLLRQRARRMLVVCPAPLQVQWREQMRDKFGLEFVIVDSESISELRRRRGVHVNPWAHHPRLITSIDFLKRDRPLRLFRETLPDEGEPRYPRRWDVLILDEAHNAAPSGRGKYATDSLRTACVRELAPHFEHKLFLTATPHNGYRESFSALLELLDDRRFARTTEPDRKQLDAVMVRRLKRELPPKWDGTPRFAARRIVPIEVEYPDQEREVHGSLRAYAKSRTDRAADTAGRTATEFVLKTLKKRLFSSPQAFLITLRKHRKSLTEARRGRRGAAVESVLRRQVQDLDDDFAEGAEDADAAAEALDTAARLFVEPSADEIALLDRMEQWAETAAARGDAKSRRLLDWLEENLRPLGDWTDERVILFTEYRATQKWLHDSVLAPAGFTEGTDDGRRLLQMHGGMTGDEREAVKAAFQAPPERSPVRILLATDSASEGLDLQNHCSKLIHYEIPWNPNRLEQRNGRIDRHGQRADEVLVHHFVAAGFDSAGANSKAKASDLAADLEFLARVAQKVDSIREDLGSYGNVLADDVESAMLGGRHTLHQTEAVETRADPARRMLTFERDVRRRCEELREQFKQTEREQRLDPENVRRVVGVGLDLAGQPPLEPLDDGGGGEPSLFHVPELVGAWAGAAAGLADPFTGERRPITFDRYLASKRRDVVLAHLGHRLVAMCLRLLRAEVWAGSGARKLNRVAARIVPDDLLDTPAVVGHARLVVIGGDTRRLHEQVLVAGGTLREGRFKRMNVGDTDDALRSATGEEPAAAVKDRLAALWPTVEEPLRTALDARMNARLGGLRNRLEERAEKEAADAGAVLNELAAAIRRELDESGGERQLALFEGEERVQRQADLDHLRRRLEEIPGEIERETTAVHRRFADPQPRLFPVAVTFLVPRQMADD